MTIEINLLPWREEKRARRSKRFYVALGGAALLGIAGGYAMTWFYQQQVEVQRQRNAYIETQTRQFDSSIREVGDLETVRDQVIEKVGVFTELQNGRSQTVHVMSDLITSLEEGVHYTQFSRQDDGLRLSGRAEDNGQVSDQLRRLGAAASFTEPVLSGVEAEGGGERRSFSLSMSQRMPATHAEKSSGGTEEERP
ncbi:PilN domain-containing protein [Halomonas icarae]|uniref:Fimbrial assembly protein n=1 Tax=Halomonas icarae TaxID=2691040 RepID=A0A7X5AND4_9GAMM|nr:PilN domain-containing protein [Halomonas icarae]MDR5900733.1 PilN domain-containing protein [Halomonas icarae]NAW13799.1 fimbrial assembly protein [Halomonas icarae]